MPACGMRVPLAGFLSPQQREIHMNNPKIVVNSIIDSSEPSQAGESKIAIYPVSIRRYAYLELLGSPFLDPSVAFSVQTVIPSAFIFTHSAEELKKYKSTDAEALKQAAYDWADTTLKIDDLPELIKCITKQMSDLNKAAPDASSGTEETSDGKKKE